MQPVAPHVFKTAQKDSHAAMKIFQHMQKTKIKRIGVLTSNTGFGKAGKEQIEKLAPQYGIEIAASEVYDKAATDLTAEVTKMKAAKVEAVLNWSIEPAQAIAIKNIRQIGLTIPISRATASATSSTPRPPAPRPRASCSRRAGSTSPTSCRTGTRSARCSSPTGPPTSRSSRRTRAASAATPTTPS